MAYIAVDKLQQGMVLDEDVRDMNTRLLLCKGQQIDQNHIRVLKIWGVMGVSIVGSAKENSGDALPMDNASTERVKETINLVFKNADLKNPLLREIYRNSLIQRLKGRFGDGPVLTVQTSTDGYSAQIN
jgi:hypothetical protein